LQAIRLRFVVEVLLGLEERVVKAVDAHLLLAALCLLQDVGLVKEATVHACFFNHFLGQLRGDFFSERLVLCRLLICLHVNIVRDNLPLLAFEKKFFLFVLRTCIFE
jgi:hypothetical protein